MSAKLTAVLSLLCLSVSLYFCEPSAPEANRRDVLGRRDRGMALYTVWQKTRGEGELERLDQESLAVYGCHAKDLPRILYQTPSQR